MSSIRDLGGRASNGARAGDAARRALGPATRSGSARRRPGRSTGCRAPSTARRGSRTPSIKIENGTGAAGQRRAHRDDQRRAATHGQAVLRFTRTADGEELLAEEPHSLLVAGAPAVHPRGERLPPAGAAVPRLRRRAALRAGPAWPRAARPEGRGARPGPAQRRGDHPVPAVQPGLRAAVEQPGDRPGRTGRQRHPLGGRQRAPDRLLGHRGRARQILRAATPTPPATRRCCRTGRPGSGSASCATAPRTSCSPWPGSTTGAGCRCR